MQYNKDYNSNSRCDPCASDNSLSSDYERSDKANISLDYRYLEENINNLEEGTIYILRLIEKRGFEDGDFILDNPHTTGLKYKRDEFLEKYGPHLPNICCQLRELGITNLRYSKGDDIIVSKITVDNIRSKQVSFYYASDKTRNDKFLIDVNEMAKLGFYLYKFSPVLSEKRHGGIVQGWTELVNKGYIATFEKQIC